MYCILKVTCPALRITCILVFSYVTLLLSILIFHYYHHLFLYYLGKTHNCCPALLTCLTTLHWQCGIEPESNNTKWSYPLINRGWSAFTLCISIYMLALYLLTGSPGPHQQMKVSEWCSSGQEQKRETTRWWTLRNEYISQINRSVTDLTFD